MKQMESITLYWMKKIRCVYEFWYDYVKPKYGEKQKFHCLHKNNDVYKDIAEDVEARFDT